MTEAPHLLEEDEAYLRDKGYAFAVHWGQVYPGQGTERILIISGFKLAVGRFVTPVVTNGSPTSALTPITETSLLLRFLPGYNDAALDMYWVDPELRLASSGAHPANSEVFEVILERRWQRFSRHLPGGAWRPGLDNLASFMPLIRQELQ